MCTNNLAKASTHRFWCQVRKGNITSAINLTKNPIQYSKTKHIEIRHHFIRGHVQKGESEIKFVKSKN